MLCGSVWLHIFSILGFERVHVVSFPELLLVLWRANQHNLCKMSVPFVPEARYLLPCADRATDDRVMRFRIKGRGLEPSALAFARLVRTENTVLSHNQTSLVRAAISYSVTILYLLRPCLSIKPKRCRRVKTFFFFARISDKPGKK